jgi:hypothetical protein
MFKEWGYLTPIYFLKFHMLDYIFWIKMFKLHNVDVHFFYQNYIVDPIFFDENYMVDPYNCQDNYGYVCNIIFVPFLFHFLDIENLHNRIRPLLFHLLVLFSLLEVKLFGLIVTNLFLFFPSSPHWSFRKHYMLYIESYKNTSHFLIENDGSFLKHSISLLYFIW